MSFVSLSQYLEEQEQGLPCCAIRYSYQKMTETRMSQRVSASDTCTKSTSVAASASELTLMRLSEELNRLVVSQNDDILLIVEEFTQSNDVKEAIDEAAKAEEEERRRLQQEQAKQDSEERRQSETSFQEEQGPTSEPQSGRKSR